MSYSFNINDLSFKSLKSGKKKIETRIESESHPKSQFEGMKPGEKIILTNISTKEVMEAEIIRVKHYKDVAELLDKEGQKNVMSYDCSREEALVSWNVYSGYEEGIKKHGIWAIEVKPI